MAISFPIVNTPIHSAHIVSKYIYKMRQIKTPPSLIILSTSGKHSNKNILSSINQEVREAIGKAYQLLPELQPYLCAHHELLHLSQVLFAILKETSNTALLTVDQSELTTAIHANLKIIFLEIYQLCVCVQATKSERDSIRQNINLLIDQNIQLLKKHGCPTAPILNFSSVLQSYLKEKVYYCLLLPLLMIYHPNCRLNDDWDMTGQVPQQFVPFSIYQLCHHIPSSLRYITEHFDWLCCELSEYVTTYNTHAEWARISQTMSAKFSELVHLKHQLIKVEDIQKWIHHKRENYFNILSQLNHMNWKDDLDTFISLKTQLQEMEDNLFNCFGNLSLNIAANNYPLVIQGLTKLNRCFQIARGSIHPYLQCLNKICQLFSTHALAIKTLLKDKPAHQDWILQLTTAQPLTSQAFLNACNPDLLFHEFDNSKQPKKGKKANKKKSNKNKVKSNPQKNLNCNSPSPQSTKESLPLSITAPPLEHPHSNKAKSDPCFTTLSSHLTCLLLQKVKLPIPKSKALYNLTWHLQHLASFSKPDLILEDLSPFTRLSLISGTLGWAIEQAYTMQLSEREEITHHLVHLHQLTQNPDREVPPIVQELVHVNQWIRFWQEKYDHSSFLHDLYPTKVEIPRLLQHLHQAATAPHTLDKSKISDILNSFMQQGLTHLTSLLTPLLENTNQIHDNHAHIIIEPIQPLENSLKELLNWTQFADYFSLIPPHACLSIPQKKLKQITCMQSSLQELIQRLPKIKEVSEVVSTSSWALHWLHEIAAEALDLIIYEKTGKNEYQRHLGQMAKQVELPALDTLIQAIDQVHNKVRYPLNYKSSSKASLLIEQLQQFANFPEIEEGFTVVLHGTHKHQPAKLNELIKIMDELIANALLDIRLKILSHSYTLSKQK